LSGKEKTGQVLGSPTDLGERFIAILLHAQRTRHKCVFADYLREMGRRIEEEYIRKEEEGVR